MTHAKHHDTHKKHDDEKPAKAVAEPVAPEPPVARAGVLHAVQDGAIVLAKSVDDPDTPGESAAVAGKLLVTVNGVVTVLDDLKRGDGLTLAGDPVSVVTASRR